MKTLFKYFLLLIVSLVATCAYSQVPIDLQQKTALNADSSKIMLVSNESTGAPYKTTIGTLFNRHTGYIHYKSSNADADDVPQGMWKIYKNTATDSVFLYVNDSATVYKINLTKVE